ncbi:HAMP domain-containing histidine kinase, partial [bacterium]|nr:HAMP domain-containing histidine kinase [bacterium]
IIDEKNEFLLTSSGAILSSLVSIAGFSRALLDGIGGALSDKQEKYLNLINTNSKDLSYDLEKLFTLFRAESKKHDYNCRNFDLISLIKSINRVYEKDIKDKKIIFTLDYSHLTQRDCALDPEIMEYILRCIMEIFVRFSNLGKCSLNIGHPPLDFLKTRDFSANISQESEKYILVEAKITDLVFNQDELDNIFDTYYKGSVKRPIGLKASLNLLKRYISDFGGDIWVYSKQNFGTMFTFVLPLK